MFRISLSRISLLFFAFIVLLVAGAATAQESPKDGLTDEDRAGLVDLLEKSRSELEALAAQTDADHWNTRTDPERWSVGEVVEHLVLTEDSLFGMVDAALASQPDPEWVQIAESGIDGVVTALKDRSQKFQAPEVLQPTGKTSRDELLGHFAARRAKTLDYVLSTQAPVKRHTATGPPGKMNVHQWLALIGAHNLRHNQQIIEVINELK